MIDFYRKYASSYLLFLMYRSSVALYDLNISAEDYLIALIYKHLLVE
jgi:hypothetical protein